MKTNESHVNRCAAVTGGKCDYDCATLLPYPNRADASVGKLKTVPGTSVWVLLVRDTETEDEVFVCSTFAKAAGRVLSYVLTLNEDEEYLGTDEGQKEWHRLGAEIQRDVAAGHNRASYTFGDVSYVIEEEEVL